MPDDLRLTVRFSPDEREAVERAARAAGVATGALVRECALRWAPVLAAEIVARGEIRLRRRAAPRPSPRQVRLAAARASSEGPESEPVFVKHRTGQSSLGDPERIRQLMREMADD